MLFSSVEAEELGLVGEDELVGQKGGQLTTQIGHGAVAHRRLLVATFRVEFHQAVNHVADHRTHVFVLRNFFQFLHKKN